MNWSIPITVDLGAGRRPVRGVLNEVLAHPNNNLAHSIEFTVMRNGVAENLAGASAVAYCVREDGTAVYRPGVISGNKVTVLLSQACYAQKGKLRIVAQLTHPTDGLMSLADFVISIAQPIPGTIVDDSHIIHDIAEIVALYDSLNALNQLCANNEQTRTLNETNRQVNEQLREVAEDERSAAEAARSVFEAWNSGKAYVVGNKVAKDGSSYVCIAPNTNQAPPNATYWLLIAAKGDNTTASAVSTAGGSNVQAALNSLESRATDLESTASEHASQLAETADNAALWRAKDGNPATIYPVPKSRLYPRVELVATQSGTGDPSPENIRPILPSLAVGQKLKAHRTGKNLIPNTLSSVVVSGVTLTKKSDGGITAVGTATEPISKDIFGRYGGPTVITLFPGTYSIKSTVGLGYTITLYRSGDNVRIFDSSSPSMSTLTLTEKTEFNRCLLYVINGQTINTTVYPQLELGSVATPYEPYAGDEYEIEAPQDLYGWPDAPVVFDVANGLVTVSDLVKVLTGTEDSHIYAEMFYLNKLGLHEPYNLTYHFGRCSHYPYTTYAIGKIGVTFGDSPSIVYKPNGDYTLDNAGLLAWKAYLAEQYANGTPVTVQYRLATPITIPIDPVTIKAIQQLDRYTPRQNVVMVDKGTVEVGYAKSPIRESDELRAAILTLGGAFNV